MRERQLGWFRPLGGAVGADGAVSGRRGGLRRLRLLALRETQRRRGRNHFFGFSCGLRLLGLLFAALAARDALGARHARWRSRLSGLASKVMAAAYRACHARGSSQLLGLDQPRSACRCGRCVSGCDANSPLRSVSDCALFRSASLVRNVPRPDGVVADLVGQPDPVRVGVLLVAAVEPLLDDVVVGGVGEALDVARCCLAPRRWQSSSVLFF